MSTFPPQDPAPAVSTLLPGPAEADASGAARRLAQRTGLSVAVSINLPPNSPAMQAFVERRLVAELEALGLARAALAAQAHAKLSL